MEMQQLRAISEDAIKSRDPAAVMMKKVEKHFKNVERTTIRKCARSTSLRLPDVRQMVARLIDFGVLERDGEIWEDSVQSGQRNAAAYRWKGERK
jgi:predicted transcriptional regulator